MSRTNMSRAMFNPLHPWRHPLTLFRRAGYNLTALPVAAITFAVIIALLSLTVGLVFTFVFAIPIAWLLFVVSRGLGKIERSRVSAFMDVEIADPITPFTPGGWFSRLWQRVRSGTRWKEIAPTLPASRRRSGLRAHGRCVGWLDRHAAHARRGRRAARRVGEVLLLRAPPWTGRGLAARSAWWTVFVAPWVTIGVARIELALARALLGPSAARSTPRRSAGSRRAARLPSTAPSRSVGASSAICTTAPSSASWRWPPTWVRRGTSSSMTTRRPAERWLPMPTRRPRRR